MRQADSRTLCLPRRRSDGYTAPFPLVGEIPPVSVLLLSLQRPFAFAGAPFIGLGIKVPQKIPQNWGQQWLISLGWGYYPTAPGKVHKPSATAPNLAQKGFLWAAVKDATMQGLPSAIFFLGASLQS